MNPVAPVTSAEAGTSAGIIAVRLPYRSTAHWPDWLTRPPILKTSVFDRLSEVPAATWNSLLAGQATVYGTDFWGVIEDSGLNDIHCRYILVSDDDGNPMAAAGFYTITTDIAIFAPRWLRRLLIGVRRLIPGFLRVRILECGTPITLVSRPYAARPGADDSAISRRAA